MNTFLSIRDLHKKVTATVVDGSPSKTSLPCIAAAHIPSSSVRAKMQPMTHPDRLNPALGRGDCDSPYPPCYGWLSSSSLPTDNQRPARPQPPPAPSTVMSESLHGSDMRLESQPATLCQPQPAGPTDNWLQNITASVCILVQVLWVVVFGSTRGWAQLRSNNESKVFFLFSPRAVSGGADVLSKKRPKDVIS